MRRFALTAAVALLAGWGHGAQAHLLPSGATSLLGLMTTADGMLVARAAAATYARDEQHAATPFLARETVAGVAPVDGFMLDQRAPILRYAEAQDALLMVVREQEGAQPLRWISAQPAGAGIVLDGPTIDDETRTVLRELWGVAHREAGAAPDAARAASALVAALSLPEQKLRALAFLDLSTLAGDPAHFSARTVARLQSYGDQPGDDAQLASAVRDLGRRLAPHAKDATAGEGATEGSKP